MHDFERFDEYVVKLSKLPTSQAMRIDNYYINKYIQYMYILYIIY